MSSAASCVPRYGRDAKVVHFLGKVKPWSLAYDAQKGEVKGHSPSPDVYQLHPDYLLMWWQLYSKQALPLLQRAYGDAPFDSGFIEGSEEASRDLAAARFDASIKCRKFGGFVKRLCSSEGTTPSAFGWTITGKRLIRSTFFGTSLGPKMLVAAGISRRLS